MTGNQALNHWGRCSRVEAFAASGLIGRVCQDVGLGEDQIQPFMVNELSAVAVMVSGVSQGKGNKQAPATAGAADADAGTYQPRKADADRHMGNMAHRQTKKRN